MKAVRTAAVAERPPESRRRDERREIDGEGREKRERWRRWGPFCKMAGSRSYLLIHDPTAHIQVSKFSKDGRFAFDMLS